MRLRRPLLNRFGRRCSQPTHESMFKLSNFNLLSTTKWSTTTVSADRMDGMGMSFHLSPVHDACRRRDFVTLDTLLFQGPPWLDVNGKDSDGETPLHICARVTSIECALLLLCAQPVIADVTISNHHGKTPLDLATSLEHGEVQAPWPPFVPCPRLRVESCTLFLTIPSAGRQGHGAPT
jgi:hypothetical protein